MKDLFDKRFVHFMWEDEFEGKEGFFADDICELTNCVLGGDMHHAKVSNSLNTAYPFKDTNNSCWVFFYYDPNYECKKAYAEGKELQYKTVCGEWEDVPYEWKFDDELEYRIKPKSKSRPFSDIKELVAHWDLMYSTSNRPSGTMPLIWVKHKESGSVFLVTGFDNNTEEAYGIKRKACVFIEDMWKDMDDLYKDFTFLDGKPCGVEE